MGKQGFIAEALEGPTDPYKKSLFSLRLLVPIGPLFFNAQDGLGLGLGKAVLFTGSASDLEAHSWLAWVRKGQQCSTTH